MNYQVVLTGLRPGVDAVIAAGSVASAFKLDETNALALVRSRDKIIKRGVPLEVAARYEKQLAACGCLVVVSPEASAPVASTPPPIPAPIVQPRTAVPAQVPVGPKRSAAGAAFKTFAIVLFAILGVMLALDELDRGWRQRTPSLLTGQIVALVLLFVLPLRAWWSVRRDNARAGSVVSNVTSSARPDVEAEDDLKVQQARARLDRRIATEEVDKEIRENKIMYGQETTPEQREFLIEKRLEQLREDREDEELMARHQVRARGQQADVQTAIDEAGMSHMSWVIHSPRSQSSLYKFIAGFAGSPANEGFGPNPNAVWLAILCRALNKL